MGIGIGMRGKDLQKFLVIAKRFNVLLLVRHTNADSLRYVGLEGYYPKPAMVKGKTADMDPPAVTLLSGGRLTVVRHEIAGLVVHPGIHPGAYKAGKHGKAMKAWGEGLKILSAKPPTDGDAAKPESWSAWGVDRAVSFSSGWRWRVDIEPLSKHYGCLQLQGPRTSWSYIHGDYDLKDVIAPGREAVNERSEGTMHGVLNYTPRLQNQDFETIRLALNQAIGADMVQHGSEAQYAWHGDEPITVAFPDGAHLLLIDAVTVQRWYVNRNREVLAKMGANYAADKSHMFHFGPTGMFAPGMEPTASWG